MKIKKQKQNLIINTDGKSILIYKDSKNDLNTTEYSGVVNIGDKKIEGSNVMGNPGEYEIEDVLYSIFAYGDNLDHPEIIFIDSNENVRVMYLLSHVDNLEKSIIERLPDINVLIAEIDIIKLDETLQIVSDLEPDIFVPLSDSTNSEAIQKAMGISEIETVSTLTISQKDIDTESSDLKVYLLNN